MLFNLSAPESREEKEKSTESTGTRRKFVCSLHKITVCILTVLVVGGVCGGVLLAGGRENDHADTEAPEQNVTDETESVKILVSSPVIARDAEVVKVTIGNIGETPISYNTNMELQVQCGEDWCVVPGKSDPKGQDTTVTLEPGMAQDEELNLADYDLDYDADAYRIITYVDGVPYSAEFQFESAEQ